MKNFKLKIAMVFVPLILLTAHRVKIDLDDRITYFFKTLFAFAPIVFLLEFSKNWVNENLVYILLLGGVLLANAIIGVIFHCKKNSFDITDFIKKNTDMLVYTAVVYFCLSAIHNSVKETMIGSEFLALIQVVTLFYPISKIFKNIFILTEGKCPPVFIMQKLYDFEKNGDLKTFFEKLNNPNDFGFEEMNEPTNTDKHGN